MSFPIACIARSQRHSNSRARSLPTKSGRGNNPRSATAVPRIQSPKDRQTNPPGHSSAVDSNEERSIKGTGLADRTVPLGHRMRKSPSPPFAVGTERGRCHRFPKEIEWDDTVTFDFDLTCAHCIVLHCIALYRFNLFIPSRGTKLMAY